MEGALFGMPLFTVGLIGLGLAVLWYFVWPKDGIPEPFKQLHHYRPRPAWMQSVLRWFHTLTWSCWPQPASSSRPDSLPS
jgi:hypothetical protein